MSNISRFKLTISFCKTLKKKIACRNLSSRKTIANQIIKAAASFCLLLLGFSLQTHAQNNEQSKSDMFPMPIAVPVPNADEYIQQRDVVYRETDSTDLKADIFLPKTKNVSFPTVVFVHGGPIRPSAKSTAKDSTFYQNYGTLATKFGFAGIVFNHRMHSLSDLETPKQDIKALFSFVQKNADSYSLNKNNMCVWYFSGGGNFVASMLDEKPAWLHCIVIYYGAMGPDALKAMGIPVSVELPKQYDPLPKLENKTDWDPKIFIAEAGKDAPGLNQKLRQFSQSALANGWSIEYWNHPTGPHGFDATTHDERSKLIIYRTMAFLKENL